MDVALRVDEATFDRFAENRINSVRPGTKLQKTLRIAARKGKLSKFDISPEFGRTLQEVLRPASPFDVDFSIIEEGSPFDIGPFIRM